MISSGGKLFILQRYVQSNLRNNLPLKIKVDVRYTTMVPYHILTICKTFPRRDISNALLLVIVRLLVVNAKFLFRTANIVLISRRAVEQVENAKEPVQDQYQDGGLLYLLTWKFAVLYWRDSLKPKCCANPDLLDTNFSENETRQLERLVSIKLGRVIESLLALCIQRIVRTE